MALDSAHLELLAGLLEHSTLAAASQAINLSPSAASRRLQDAERLVGVPLAEKSGRTISLTPAGRLLAEAAATSARQLSEAELAARWLGGGGPRPLRIGVSFFDTIAWLLPRQDAMQYEVVRTGTQTGPGATAGDIDITIDVVGSGSTGVDTSAWTILGEDQLTLVVGRNHPLAAEPRISVADIVDHRYLASSTNPLPGFEFERFFLPSSDCPSDIVAVNSFSMLLDLVARNDGVTIQPSRAVAETTRSDLVLVPLDRPVPVSWVAGQGKRSDPRVGQLLQFACDLFD